MDCEASRLTEVISLVALSTCPPLLATLTLMDTLTQAQHGNIISRTMHESSISLCPEVKKVHIALDQSTTQTKGYANHSGEQSPQPTQNF